MNEAEIAIAAAIRSTQDRKRDLVAMLEKRAIRSGKTAVLKKIAIQDFILEALREKAEREKGCGYCNTTLYIRAERTLLPVMAPLTYADALEHELINITGKDYVPAEKRY